MKRYSFLLLFIGALFACRSNKPQESDKAANTFTIDTQKHEVDTLVIAENDTAFVVKEKLDKDDVGGKKEIYEINILFSNKKWPVLTYHNAIGADLYLAGDINGDYNPKLLLRPEWFSSCWASINLFSLKNNVWQLIKTGSMYYCADEYPLDKRIEKIDNKYYLLTDSATDNKFVIDKKEIKF